MVRRYCFQCGAPLKREEPRPAALCRQCIGGGPHVPPDRLRWEVRGPEGAPRGPFSKDALIDQLLRGAVGPEDALSRGGGPWLAVCAHPDTLAYYLPGTPEFARLNSTQTEARKERRQGDLARGGRQLGGVAAALALLAVGGLGATRGWFIIPEHLITSASALLDGAGEVVSSQVEQAVDKGAAAEAVARGRELPGDALLTELQGRWPAPSGAAALRLHRGRAAMWEGTREALAEAVPHLEQACVLAPNDPEAWSSLAEVYARRIDEDASRVEAMVVAADRARALAEGSAAAQRAAGWATLAGGNPSKAADLVSGCADPPALAATRGSKVDLGCALLAAETQGLDDVLLTLEGRLQGAFPVRAARARVALTQRRYADAVAHGKALTLSHPGDPAGWRALLRASVQVGAWVAAREAGEALLRVAPFLLAERALLAEIHLKVRRDARRALADYEQIVADPGFERLPKPGPILADAATAAGQAGQHARAIELAERALAVSAGHPGATLARARALVATGKAEESEKALRTADLAELSGHSLAVWHLGAALVHIAAGRERQADAELTSAADADPGWSAVRLEWARNRLSVGNRDGAVEILEKAAFLDLSMDKARSPLGPLWVPPIDTASLRAQLERELLGDARFSGRGPAVIGVVSTAGGMDDAPRWLQRALQNTPDSAVAHAALAQHAMARGDARTARAEAAAVVESSENLGVIYGVEGWAAAEMGDASHARARFVQALEQAPNSPGLHRWRAEALVRAGDPRAARRSVQDALRLAPDDVLAQAMLVDLDADGR
jgi:tetratricopeptide (TPR) repeat protein